MTLTAKQIYDLNNMNVAAQSISLGSFLMGIGGEAGVYMITPEDISSGSVIIVFSGSAISKNAVVVARDEEKINASVSSSGSLLTVSGSTLAAGDTIYYYMS